MTYQIHGGKKNFLMNKRSKSKNPSKCELNKSVESETCLYDTKIDELSHQKNNNNR